MKNTVPSGAHRAPSVARAATVLRLLAGEPAGLGVSEVARRVGLVPSTCLHVLRALVEEGFVHFDTEKKTYRTGVGLLTLAREALANSAFPKIVQESLGSLSDAHRVTAAAFEVDARERTVVVGIARSREPVSLHVNVGSRFPAYVGATGRLVAARSELSREQLLEKFKTIDWKKPPQFEEWYADVKRARREGVAIDRGNYSRGLTVLSALIPPTLDRVIRGIALLGFEHQMTEKHLREARHDLKLAVDSIVVKLS